MKRKSTDGFTNIFAVVLGGILCLTSTVCTVFRVRQLNTAQSFELMASSLSMPQGAVYKETSVLQSQQPVPLPTQPQTLTPKTQQINTAEKPYHEENIITDDESSYSGEKYPVIEQHFGKAENDYDNFAVKNTTDYDIDYEQLLNSDLGFTVEKSNKVQVLIFHTHTTESYLINDNGYYFTDYSFRSEDPERNMVAVGEEIIRSLAQNGIVGVHATEIHDRTYTGSYDRSEQTVYQYLEQYPDIKVILDIHRDAVGYDDERGKYKTFFEYNGRKAAQIMIMSGYDPNNEYGFGHWKENLTFALQLQQTAEEMYPGMTRPLYFGDFAYNMFINNGSLLIEVGTESNTLSEAKYTGSLLGNVIANVLCRHQQ